MTIITLDLRLLAIVACALLLTLWIGKGHWRKLAGKLQPKGAFAYIFIGVSLAVLLFATWLAGANTIQCQRLEPQQVNCTTHHTRWLGLVASDAVTLTNVQAAKLESYSCTKTEQVNGEEQEVADTCNNLVLVTSAGEIRPEFSATLLPAINDFLHSTQPEWAYAQNNWIMATAFAGFALIFGSMGTILVKKGYNSASSAPSFS